MSRKKNKFKKQQQQKKQKQKYHVKFNKYESQDEEIISLEEFVASIIILENMEKQIYKEVEK